MAYYVTDTMAFILYLEKRKMGTKAQTVYSNMETEKDTIYVPTFVLAELLYLSEKQRISITLKEAETYITKHNLCQEYPINLEILKAAATITDIPELHDRLIATVAVYLQLPLITNDPVIATSQHLNTIW